MLWKRISAAGQILWSQLDFTGSNITDILTRNHEDLQNLNTASYTHLTATNHTDLTDGGATTLHKHDHAAQDNLNSADYTHLTATQATDLTDAGDSTLHYHATDRARANHTGTQAADTVTVLNAQSSDYTTVKNVFDLELSTGVLGLGSLVSDHADGTVDVAAANVALRATDSDIAAITLYKVSAANLSLTDAASNFIYAQYNGGAPNYVATTIERADTNTNILIAKVYRAGTDLHINNYAVVRMNDNLRRIALRFVEVEPTAHASGMQLSETGTRNFAMTAGVMWQCTNRVSLSAFNSATGGTFTYIYRDGLGGWTEQTGQTQINNTQYDDGSGTLQTLTANRYAVGWVYAEVDEDVLVLYGQGDYTLAQANAATSPASVPPRISAQGFLCGKIILQKSAATFTSVQSAFAESLGTSTVTDHNTLTSLQGGTTNEYYHLTSTEYTGTGTGAFVRAVSPNITANSATAALTVTQTGAGNALVVEDSASPDATPFVINAGGYVRIGGAPVAGQNFRVTKNATGATTAQECLVDGAVASDVTVQADYYATNAATAASAFTLPILRHYHADQSTIGAGSTVTSQYGFYVNSSLTGATNNYGFYSNIAAATARWNFFAAGTAQNAFAGNVRIGSTVAPTVALDVTGAITASGTITGNTFAGDITACTGFRPDVLAFAAAQG